MFVTVQEYKRKILFVVEKKTECTLTKIRVDIKEMSRCGVPL